MNSNQTIELKSVYPHSNISIYNSPVISATVPSLTLTSGLNIVSAVANGTNQETPGLNPFTTIQQAASNNPESTHIMPMGTTPSNGVCLNNIQLHQQLQMHQQTFASNGQILHCSDGNNERKNNNNTNLVQIQISTPAHVVSNRKINGNDTTNNLNSYGAIQIVTKSNNNSEFTSNLSNGSSRSSTVSDSKSNETISANSFIEVNSKLKSDNSNIIDYMNTVRSYTDDCAISMKLSSSDNNLTSPRSISGKGFKCQVCNRDFTQKGNLKTHLMTHSGERPYECPTCGKNFTQKGNLDTHVKIHTETKDHRCHFCDRGFVQRGNLKTHIRSVHTKEKPYACGYCGKAFSQKGNMLTHFRTHDKEARFPCNICGKTFSQKGNLKTHQQRHGRGSAR